MGMVFGGWIVAMLKGCRAVSARRLFAAAFVLFWCSAIDRLKISALLRKVSFFP